MKIDRYDFRKPGRLPVEVEERLVSWLTGSFPVAREKWGKHLESPLAHSLAGVDTVRPIECLSELSDAVVACRVALGSDAVQTLIVLPRPLALTLAAGVLGDRRAELAPDRPLTAVEASLAEFLLQQFLSAVQDSWPGGTGITVALEEVEPAPKRSRMFKPEDNIVRATLLMSGPFGEQSWYWLVPQKGLASLFAQADVAQRTEQLAGVRTCLETLVGAMPLEVSVRLGGAVLHVSELAGLRAGDLILLDQPVTSPLAASVAGETRFLVWPGRVGAKQAFQIQSLVEC